LISRAFSRKTGAHFFASRALNDEAAVEAPGRVAEDREDDQERNEDG
jgi:hypothetical protein